MRAGVVVVGVLVLSLALIAASCSGEVVSGVGNKQGHWEATTGVKPDREEPAQAGVEWTGQLCASVADAKEWMQGAGKPPSPDPRVVKRTMSALFDSMTQGAAKVVSDMNQMGPSPLEDGDRVVAGVKTSYKQLQQAAQHAKLTVDSAAESDEQAVMQAVKTAADPVSRPNLRAPFQRLQSIEGLAYAAQQAPKCRELVAATEQQQEQGGQQPEPGR